jgi:tyrosyl-tRNA synthetase
MINRDLVTRNTIEIVTEDELNNVLQKKKPTAYCGYETSGPVHIGTMVTVNKLIDFQNAGLQVNVLFADVHTRLNQKGGEEWIQGMVEYWRESFKALGLAKAEYILGSSFQYDREYVHDVLDVGVKTTMNRALRSMQEIARDINNAHVSQVIYPLMQAVDIKALGADIAYGGIEQRKIHMLAREVLPEIGCRKPVCIHTPLLCSPQGPEAKMSSSKPETIISVDEDGDSIKKKINSAYCPPTEEDNPVLDICRLLLLPRTGSIEVKRPSKYGGDVVYESYERLLEDYSAKKLHPQDLKNAVGGNLAGILEPVRKHLGEKGLRYEKKS